MFSLFRRTKNNTKINKKLVNLQHVKTDKLAAPQAVAKYQPLSEEDCERRAELPTARVDLKVLADLESPKDGNGVERLRGASRIKTTTDGENRTLVAAQFLRKKKRSRQNKISDNVYFDKEVNIAKNVLYQTSNKAVEARGPTSVDALSITTNSAVFDDNSGLDLNKRVGRLWDRRLSEDNIATICDGPREQQRDSVNSLSEQLERQRRVRTGGQRNNSNRNSKPHKRIFCNRKSKSDIKDQKKNITHEIAPPTTQISPVTLLRENVVYRNSKKNSKNPENATKRQSWLALTLKNVRYRGKKEANREVVVDNNTANESVVTVSSLSAEDKAAITARNIKAAQTRKSFFFSSSKSIDKLLRSDAVAIDTQTASKIKRPISTLFHYEAKTPLATTETPSTIRESSGERTKLKGSRHFLSEILMARGRNHKRQHNQQRKQQHQHQPEQKQRQQQQQSKSGQSQQQQQQNKNNLYEKQQTHHQEQQKQYPLELQPSSLTDQIPSRSVHCLSTPCEFVSDPCSPNPTSSQYSTGSPLDECNSQSLLDVRNDYHGDPILLLACLETNPDPVAIASAGVSQTADSVNSNQNSNSLSGIDLTENASVQPESELTPAEHGEAETTVIANESDTKLSATSTHSKSLASTAFTEILPELKCAEAVSLTEFVAADQTVEEPLNLLTAIPSQINETSNAKENVFPTDSRANCAFLTKKEEDYEALGELDVSERVNSQTPTTIKSKNAKTQSNDLTQSDRDRWVQQNKTDSNNKSDINHDNDDDQFTMGQTNAKTEKQANISHRESRDFGLNNAKTLEHLLRKDETLTKKGVVIPSITVVDCSAEDDSAAGHAIPAPEGNSFYEFESQPCQRNEPQIRKCNENECEKVGENANSGVSISVVDDDDDSYERAINHGVSSTHKWQFFNSVSLLHRRTPLAKVREEIEEEEEVYGGSRVVKTDNEETTKSSSVDLERERTSLGSTNTNDLNLSNGLHDSVIGSDVFSLHADSAGELMPAVLRCDVLNERYSSASSAPITCRLPFVRDSSSTDCDETLMPCDDYDLVADTGDDQSWTLADERLVCIESISLPDVVVESTNNIYCSSGHSCNSLLSAGSSSSSGSEHIINVNGATCNSIGNVHFLPIHVEGGAGGTRQKRRSLDDSVIGGKKSFAHLNGHQTSKTVVEITAGEEDQVLVEATTQKPERPKELSEQNKSSGTAGRLKRDLVNQESRYSAQLEDAQNNVYNLQTKINELQTHIENQEKELSLKTWSVERLQGELAAAHKDDEYVRKRLKLLEDEKTNLRHKYVDNEEALNRRYEELEEKCKELEEKYKQTRQLASDLHTQLAAAQSDAEECREQMEQLRAEMEEQLRILRNALENSEAERRISEDKWQKQFEMLRTHNQDREESLMSDCEWQLRQMQRVCKEKIDKAEFGRREAIEQANILESTTQEQLQELQLLRSFEAEAISLRGLVSEQDQSLHALTDQMEALKSDLKTANENLEDQIETVRKIKYQCDNKIYDKERELIQRIDQVRNEAAAFWENKLYTEMTRLKSELESVFIDERREALDKLQAEHIEELRALTTRYTANEEELRAEIAELHERIKQKSSEFIEFREKSDSALLETRMHLDRADREYQNAMFREEARREALEESLHKEFENEKNEMEEKFRERLGEVKEEFATELQISNQEMAEQHRKEMEQQRIKLLAEKEVALQELTERHRQKLANAEDKIKDIELRHQRDLKDLKASYDAEKVALDRRDISNVNEIEQLHRKCRCLTNLFEEMRMRYERREPRQEDLREIADLRSRCESQERDLYLLTDRLREMQIQMEELQGGDGAGSGHRKIGGKTIKRLPPKMIPTNCDVIYEENEERDSPPPSGVGQYQEDEDEEGTLSSESRAIVTKQQDNKMNGQLYSTNNKNGNNNRNAKYSDHLNEDDGHMITAV